MCVCLFFSSLNDDFKDSDDDADGDHHKTRFVDGASIAQILVVAAVSLVAGDPPYHAFRCRGTGPRDDI